MTSPWEHSVELVVRAVQNPTVVQKLLTMGVWAAALRRRPLMAATGAALIWGAPGILRRIMGQWGV